MTSYDDLDPISKYKFIKSKTIKQEINRFESVHPCIYEIYDLLEEISDIRISSQIKNFVHCIEDSFINSQEWTLTHGIDEIRLGIIGASSSGKSSLIHRYLTGTYIQNEYDEGGRFKKEVNLDGDDSHLMLIRDDGAEPPDYQFSNWVDGVIFIFSLENEDSLNILYNLHEQLFKHRNQWFGFDLPCILVGTQDYISETNPRVIDDSKARKLAADLKMSAYYETCATYGLNVEKVFQEAAISLHDYKIKRISRDRGLNIQKPMNMSYTNTGMGTLSKPRPNSNNSQINMNRQTISYNSIASPPIPPTRDASQGFGTMKKPMKYPPLKSKPLQSNSSSPIPNNNFPNSLSTSVSTMSSVPNPTFVQNPIDSHALPALPTTQYHHQHSTSSPSNQFNRSAVTSVSLRDKSQSIMTGPTNSTALNSTQIPLQQTQPITSASNNQKTEKKPSSNGLGVGRVIPIKQGNLYKRRGDRAITKDRKKKYVTLTMDARLTYHPNINDYMEDVHGKEIDLSRVTIKIPGVPYRQGAGGIPNMGAGVAISAMKSRNRASDPTGGAGKGLKEMAKKQKKKFISNENDSYEFQIVSLDGKQWCFDTNTEEDRNEWVKYIEAAILECLQNMEIRKSPVIDNTQFGMMQINQDGTGQSTGHSTENNGGVDDKSQTLHSSDGSTTQQHTSTQPSDADARKKMVQELTAVSGNNVCADCGQISPSWASLNLGELVCIECSGVHRRLGTHISRVRSLQLDQWAPEWIEVMKAIGNTVANTVWEAAVNVSPRNLKKPEPTSSASEKEEWIRSKYERREFLPPLPCQTWTNQQQLIDAISRRDIRQVILCLAVSSEAEINASYTKTDSRAAIHFAAAIGDIVSLQLLIWYKAQVDLKDSSGRNAYFYARMYGKDGVAEFLFKNGATRQNLPQMPITSNMPLSSTINNVPVSTSSLSASVPTTATSKKSMLPLQPSTSSSSSSNNSSGHQIPSSTSASGYQNIPQQLTNTTTNNPNLNNSPKQPFLLTSTPHPL